MDVHAAGNHPLVILTRVNTGKFFHQLYAELKLIFSSCSAGYYLRMDRMMVLKPSIFFSDEVPGPALLFHCHIQGLGQDRENSHRVIFFSELENP